MTALPIENVADYLRPPVLKTVQILKTVQNTLRVRLGCGTAAEKTRGYRVLETHHAPTYFLPKEDVTAILTPARGRSICEWKSVATYWDVTSGDVTAPRAAWSYSDPTGRFAAIAGHVAFYAFAMDTCFVGYSEVIPQPGNFYGGWVIDNLRGPIKGAPGTEHW